MDNIMALEDHSRFKVIHGSQFMGQSKDKVFVFEILVNFLNSGAKLVKCM